MISRKTRRAVYRVLHNRARSKSESVKHGRPLGWYSEDLECEIAAPDSATVYEQDDDPIDSGLLDQYGNRLYRIPTRRKIGFT